MNRITSISAPGITYYHDPYPYDGYCPPSWPNIIINKVVRDRSNEIVVRVPEYLPHSVKRQLETILDAVAKEKIVELMEQFVAQLKRESDKNHPNE